MWYIKKLLILNENETANLLILGENETTLRLSFNLNVSN